MMELGLLLIRVTAGLLLAGHGARKVLGWFGGPGVRATGESFEELGYPSATAMAVVAGATEIVAGLGLVGGLFTPLAAAAVIGVMVNAAVSAHGRYGLWAENGGYEYPLLIASVAGGLATAGPGALSLDALFGVAVAGPIWGLGALGVGVVSAMIVLATRSISSSRIVSR